VWVHWNIVQNHFWFINFVFIFVGWRKWWKFF
jgi:hypothetical protein